MDNRLDAERRVKFGTWLESARFRLVSRVPAYRPPGSRLDHDTVDLDPQSPDREVRFVFESITGDPKLAWRMEMQIPANSIVGTELQVSVFDIEGHPAGNGTLKLAGCDIRILEGRGSILFELFIGGARVPNVSFVRDGGDPSPGLLTFFSEGKG